MRTRRDELRYAGWIVLFRHIEDCHDDRGWYAFHADGTTLGPYRQEHGAWHAADREQRNRPHRPTRAARHFDGPRVTKSKEH